jgi:holo-[acyl-carrier protein] synthase
MGNMKDKVCVSGTHLRTGIDIVHNDDMYSLTDEAVGVLLTELEWAHIAEFSNRLQRVAGRFACKEAIMKVLGRGMDQIELVDIEILHDKFGKPIVSLQGSALRRWRQIGFSQLEVSISHHRGYAVAIAVAMKLGVEIVEETKNDLVP